MKDDLTRRDFLMGAGLVVTGIISSVGVTGATTPGRAQEQDPNDKEHTDEEPKEDDLFADDDSSQEETRACPQCGALMYKQGDTWSCETCGYSYVE